MKYSIGMLLPMSTICSMSKDFEKGLYLGIQKQGVDTSEIEFVKEFVGQGGDKKVEESLDRLFSYHAVDLVTGIVSNNVIQTLSEKFQNKSKIILNNNLGEHALIPERNNEFIFVNSPHFWQQCWLLGRWASQNLGKKYALVSALYDGGYGFQMMFDFGMRDEVDDTQLELAIGSMPVKGELTDVESLLDKVEESEPDFVLALFCEKEASLFLESFVKRGLHHKTAVVGLPFLFNPTTISLQGLKVYTSHHNYLGEESSVDYKNVFKELGIESGETIAKAIQAGDFGDLEKFKKVVSQNIVQANQSFTSPSKITLLENEFGENNEIHTKVILEERVDLQNNRFVKELPRMETSSWMNPYLGI